MQEDAVLRRQCRSSLENQIIGFVNFNNIVRRVAQYCNIGYSLAADKQGQGFMEEALRHSIKYSFQVMNLHRVMANYMPHNVRSGNVLKRLGFTAEGFARDYLFINGRWEDHVLTSLTNDNWRDTLTVRPFQDRDTPQNLSDYFSGKTSFISAYVDLLLARMANEDRFSDGDSQSSNDFTVNDLITFQSRDSDFTCFAIVDKTKNTLVWASRVVELSGGERRHRTGTIIDFEEQNARTITELEAVEFRKAMEAVYG